MIATENFFTDFYNANDSAKASVLVDERLTNDFIDHSPAFGNSPDKAGFRASVGFVNNAFRQHYRLEKLISQGNLQAGVWTADIQHVGEFMGVPPTQKSFTIQGITVYDIEHGLIRAHWEQFDVLTILQQVGIIQLG
jgi:predicted ester cyclase